MQRRSERPWRGIAHRRGEREARLARGGIREHDAFLGHEIRGPAGTGRGGVSMAGGREGQSARKGNGVKRLRQVLSDMSYSHAGCRFQNFRGKTLDSRKKILRILSSMNSIKLFQGNSTNFVK